MADEKDKVLLNDLFGDFAGQGFENMETGDYAPPFLKIIQAMSPQLQPNKPEYMPEAKQGQILCTTSGNLYNEVHVQPVKFEFKLVEWVPRGKGGGFVSSYTRMTVPEDVQIDSEGNMIRPNGNEISQTAYYLVRMKEENWDRVIIPMTSTQLKKSRKWNSQMAQLKFGEEARKVVPIFGCIYTFRPVIESNNKGTWWGWDIKGPEFITDRNMIEAGHEASQIQNFLPERVLIAIGHKEEEAF